MVDTFLLLTLARTGDSLQGIKKGVLELADVIAVNKADGDHVVDAKGAARELSAALHLVAPAEDGWSTPVLTCSATEGTATSTPCGTSCGPIASTSSAPGSSPSNAAARTSAGCGRRSTTASSPASAPPTATGPPTLEDQVRRGDITPTAAAEALLDEA